MSPMHTLTQDRHSALLGAAIAGVMLGIGVLTAWLIGMFTGDYLLRTLIDWPQWPGGAQWNLLVQEHWTDTTERFESLRGMTAVLGAMSGAFLALVLLATRAWSRFVVVRLWLAARGVLPWRLMGFLADARRREILRQTGGVYQFRHIRLQETLAGKPLYRDEEVGRRPRVSRRTVLVAGGLGAASAAAVWTVGARGDTSIAGRGEPGGRRVLSVRFRPGREGNSEVAYLLDDGSVRLWNWRSGDAVDVVRAKGPAYYSVARNLEFSGDGQTLLRPTADHAWWQVFIGPKSAAGLSSLPHPAVDTGLRGVVAFDVERNRLVCCTGSGRITAWEVSGSGEFAFTSERRIFHTSIALSITSARVGVAFFGDGDLALLGDDVAWRFTPSFVRGKELILRTSDVLKFRTGSAPYGVGNPLLASPFERAFVVCGQGGARVWRVATTGEPALPSQELAPMRTGAFHPSRPLLAAPDFSGGGVRLLDTADGYRTGAQLTSHFAPVLALSFSSDGRYLATGDAEGAVRVWKVQEPL